MNSSSKHLYGFSEMIFSPVLRVRSLPRAPSSRGWVGGSWFWWCKGKCVMDPLCCRNSVSVVTGENTQGLHAKEAGIYLHVSRRRWWACLSLLRNTPDRWHPETPLVSLVDWHCHCANLLWAPHLFSELVYESQKKTCLTTVMTCFGPKII